MNNKEEAVFSISVIIPTYNPNRDRLNKTLVALKAQTLALTQWELIIVDNNSTPPVKADLSWHPDAIILREPMQGLTYARLRGFNAAKNSLLVMVDDDNLLDENYLQNATTIFGNQAGLGAIGGKSLPEFEITPPSWLKEFYGSLALRDMGHETHIQSWQNNYPQYGPIGAGMAIRKEALASYMKKAQSQQNMITDRTGTSLASGGDNDIVLELLRSGWLVGYFPQLVLHHIIPKERMEVAYLAKLLNNTNHSWIKLLHSHGINPWKKIPGWTVPLRKVKGWFVHNAFAGKVNYIKWRGYCGTTDALARLEP
ncbi:glycosyltransferase [Mucilaginibacter psychrotolerans]|uniref:Glycosyltransferase family 2 protein n=1 Tax=Mucilaginibacter psychrotolerans TaxID=1524096 RepID=A0A4Y8SR57_9SPHI|nr:glycosyltransferase [Mucilaginibacter psychrotolerans]TFF40864.1 glycosyltransferase family 2 protein [Mucilaginibacter psychrotolerans]